MSASPLDLAIRYWVDDMPGASSPGTRLNNILEALSKDQPLTTASKDFLTQRGLLVLLGLANGEMHFERCSQLAHAERESRILAAVSQQQMIDARRQSDQAAADVREAAMWADLEVERLKRESHPSFLAKQKSRELRRKYGVNYFVEEHHFKRLMEILRKFDLGSRLLEADAIWLKTEGREYSSDEIVSAYNRLEADFCLAEYVRTGDVWNAVSASGHLRKCHASSEANELLMAIPEYRLKDPKLKSAVLTTHGGAMRDLSRYNEALVFAENAHALVPHNFRPCTLMGALNIELGNIEAGHEWYRKAEERGAKVDSIEADLRSVLARMPQDKQNQIVIQLLSIDPDRYGWAGNFRRRALERR